MFFDEMKLRLGLSYDRKIDVEDFEDIGEYGKNKPADYALFFMVKGPNKNGN